MPRVKRRGARPATVRNAPTPGRAAKSSRDPRFRVPGNSRPCTLRGCSRRRGRAPCGLQAGPRMTKVESGPSHASQPRSPRSPILPLWPRGATMQQSSSNLPLRAGGVGIASAGGIPKARRSLRFRHNDTAGSRDTRNCPGGPVPRFLARSSSARGEGQSRPVNVRADLQASQQAVIEALVNAEAARLELSLRTAGYPARSLRPTRARW